MNKDQYLLVRFLQENASQISHVDGKLHAWIPFYYLNRLTKYVGPHYFVANPEEKIILRHEDVCLNLEPMLDYMNIDKSVFEKEDSEID